MVAGRLRVGQVVAEGYEMIAEALVNGEEEVFGTAPDKEFWYIAAGFLYGDGAWFCKARARSACNPAAARNGHIGIVDGNDEYAC
jgi:hypothetical protein